jgi:hypothetical protein
VLLTKLTGCQLEGLGRLGRPRTGDKGKRQSLRFCTLTEYYYIAIIAALASGALAGIAAFLVSPDGWAMGNASKVFVGSAASLPFWLTAMQVLRYTETIAKHEAKYAVCWNLLSDMKRADEKGQPFVLAAYLDALVRKIEIIRGIGISFDGSRIGVAKVELPK